MKKLVSVWLVICCLIVSMSAALAVPARTGVVKLVEPATGTVVDSYNVGDERFNYMTDLSGRLIVTNGQGRLCYVADDDGAYVLDSYVTEPQTKLWSGAASQDAQVTRPDSDKLRALNTRIASAEPMPRFTQPNLIPYGYDYVGDAAEGKLREYPYNSMPYRDMEPEMSDKCPLLVLKVEFADVKCAFSDAEWHQRIYDDGVERYYRAVSDDQFYYEAASETAGTVNDGVITIELPIEAPRYTLANGSAQNYYDGIRTGLYPSTDGSNKNYAIYAECSVFGYAVQAAAERGLVDIPSYDRNNDGYVGPTELAFLVVYAGYEVASIGKNNAVNKPGMWAHSNTLHDFYRGGPQYHNLTAIVENPSHTRSVEVYKYTMMSENLEYWYNYEDPSQSLSPPRQAQYGTACHELGHDLGLMDLYDVEYHNLKCNVNSLSVMAMGCDARASAQAQYGSLPSQMDPYSKIFLNFYRPTVVSPDGMFTVYASDPASSYNILRINTDDPNVYYLVENRYFSGFDYGLQFEYPGMNPGGVVIWRIDESVLKNHWANNTVNTIEGRYGIMPLFVDSANRIPFWGGASIGLKDTAELQSNPLLTLRSYSPAGRQMYVQLTRQTDAPATGDSAAPLLWALMALLAGGTLIALLRRKRRA